MESQEAIYDERYGRSSYDERSAVRILTAESTALRSAVLRALDANPARPVSLLDFGYGTGRVTNEFLLGYDSDLSVVAYDVSTVGLQKAAKELAQHGFEGGQELRWERDDLGHVIGSMIRRTPCSTVSVTLVHGTESSDASTVQRLLLEANGREPYLVTTSWYSALGHIFGGETRRQFVRMLDDVTALSGELLLAVTTTGDLQAAQEVSANLLSEGAVEGLPIETSSDVLYVTELGQENYWHVFSTDLLELLGMIRKPKQQIWIEAIRMLDDEFETIEAEQANYARVKSFNQNKIATDWLSEDYRSVHTVAGIRSGNSWRIPACGYSSDEMPVLTSAQAGAGD